MRGYLAELLGTFFLVFTFLGAATSDDPLAAVSVSAVLVATVWAGAHISGAHFNPAITFGAFLRHRLSLADLLSYWAAQLLGALLASEVGMWIFETPPRLSDVSGVDGPLPVLVVELLFTFALVYVVLSVGAVKEQTGNLLYGLAMGLVVLAGTLTVARVSGAAFNPAIAFGMAVAGGSGWSSIWVYLLAEVAGGGFAAVFASRVARVPDTQPHG